MLRNSSITVKKDSEGAPPDYHGISWEDIEEMNNTCKHQVAVEITKGRDLAVKDLIASDPYIKFAFVPRGCKELPKDKARVFKSHYNTQTVNPVWNYLRVGCFDPQENILDKDVCIEIWDADFGRSDDFMGRISIPLSEVEDNQPKWYALEERRKKSENVSGDILVAIEVLLADDQRRMLENSKKILNPIFHWKFSERQQYQAKVSRSEVPKLLRPDVPMSEWKSMIANSLLEESKNMPHYVLDAYVALPPGSILCGTLKLMSLASASIDTYYLRVEITGFLKENNLLKGNLIIRESTKKCYIKFIPMRFNSQGISADSKLTMMVIGESYLFRGPCYVDNATRSIAMYIPRSDKYNYLPIVPRSDKSPLDPINGNLRSWLSGLAEMAEPIGEFQTPFTKIFTMQDISVINHNEEVISARILDKEKLTTEVTESPASEKK